MNVFHTLKGSGWFSYSQSFNKGGMRRSFEVVNRSAAFAGSRVASDPEEKIVLPAKKAAPCG